MFKFFRPKVKDNQYGWFGNYNTWEEASASAAGYDSANILHQTRDALLKVKNGEAVYERDSVVFDQKEYPFPLISCLLRSAGILGRPLNILDFGGSLGSTYFQVKDFIGAAACASWNIVEQPHYISCGKMHFEDGRLRFYPSINACLLDNSIDLVLLSSTVQYLPEPHAFLQHLTQHNFPFLVFDRTAFHKGTADRLTLQTVPPEIYEASYPSWFFNEENFLRHFQTNYQLICELPPYITGEAVMLIDNEPVGYNNGFYFIHQSINLPEPI